MVELAVAAITFPSLAGDLALESSLVNFQVLDPLPEYLYSG